MTSAPAIVSVQDLEKSFGATRAVRGVSLDIPAGSIFGLVGENGAGKSTLGKLIAGVETPDGGSLRIGGREVTLRSPHEGIRAGVSMMAQEIMLAPDRTVEENVLLGNLPRRGPFPDRRAMRRRFRELVELTGFELNPGAKAGSLRIADQQKVEILRSVSQDAELIVMDEPSAALTTDEVERLHHTIRAIAARGSAVLLISHFLEEILALADRVAIMRDGELVRVGPAGDETVDTLVAGMVGRALNTEYRTDKPQARGPARLQVSNLSRRGVLDGISFTVREGEILGFAGLVGSGRTEIARCVFGADRFDRGEILLDGRPLTANSPSGAIKAGVFMIPEDRKELGLLLEGSVADNLLLATLDRRSRRGWVTRRPAPARPAARRVGRPAVHAPRPARRFALRRKPTEAALRPGQGRRAAGTHRGRADPGSGHRRQARHPRHPRGDGRAGDGATNAYDDSFAFTAIAATVVGGVSIFGGSGAVWRGSLGILTFALIGNGLNLLGVDTTYQLTILGLLIFGAVAADQAFRSRAKSGLNT